MSRTSSPTCAPAALAKNGAPHMFSDVHVPNADDTKDDHAACLYPSVHTHTASHVKNGAPVIFSGVRAAAHDEDAKVYICHTRFFEGNQVHNYMHARIKFYAYSDI
jgi:hypothetical protein